MLRAVSAVWRCGPLRRPLTAMPAAAAPPGQAAQLDALFRGLAAGAGFVRAEAGRRRRARVLMAVRAMAAGERAALARSVTLVESSLPRVRAVGPCRAGGGALTPVGLGA